MKAITGRKLFRGSSRRDFLVGLGSMALLPLVESGTVPGEDSTRLSREVGLQKHVRSGTAFGSNANLTILHPNAEIANHGMDAAMAELQKVEILLSLYRPDSEPCRLNRDGRLDHPHPYLVAVLSKAR